MFLAESAQKLCLILTESLPFKKLECIVTFPFRLIDHLLRKAVRRSRRTYKAYRARRLAQKEKMLLEKQDQGKLKNYNVMKNVSTHSMINSADGKKSL